MLAWRRLLYTQIITQQSRTIVTTENLSWRRRTNCLTSCTGQLIPHGSHCLSTSVVCCKNDRGGKKSKDISETEYFDRFYEVVLKESKNDNSFALRKIQKANMSELDKKRAIQRWTFDQVVDIFVKNNLNRRGHVDFIYEALDRIVSLGLQRDLEAYRKLLMTFPQDGRMVARSTWQVELKHYPIEQDCAIEILHQLEENGLIPDTDFCVQMVELFGPRSHVTRKLRRLYYWGRKFNNANPYQLPFYLPDDPIELAILALKKMVVDVQNEMHVWEVSLQIHVSSTMGKEGLMHLFRTKRPEETFIVSAQSCNQRDLLKNHDMEKPVYVEGGYTIWLRDTALKYFVLRADTDPSLFPDPVLDENDEDLFQFETVFDTEDPKDVMRRPSDHQQDEGTILAMCITGTGSKESLIQWIRYLQETNSNLEQTSVVFKLRSDMEDEELLSIEGKRGQLKPVDIP